MSRQPLPDRHRALERSPLALSGPGAGSAPSGRLACMTEMLCFRCLTNDDERVPAVTAFVGTMLCERCAHGEERLRRQMIQEAASSMRL
jgi:hypothetical protein